jgi:hypothetical protein
MIGTCLSMFIHERYKIKFSSSNDIYRNVKVRCIVLIKHGLTI